jgi:Tol biopolymer transport system component/tetratricopeptide (TPR) repeat protein
VTTGSPSWAASFVEPTSDLLQLEDSIAGQVAEALIPQLTGEEQKQLAKRGTRSSQAHDAYLRGRWQWSTHTPEGLASALVYFTRAIDLDPEYAQAHAGIADYYIILGLQCGLPPAESFAAAKQSSATALKIDPSLAEAHTSFGVALWAYDRDYGQAAHHLQLAITVNPDYATAHQWFGMLNSARGRKEIAVASLERARKLDPRSPALAASLARAYINAGRPERAIEDLRDPARLPDEHSVADELLAWAFLAARRVDEAVRSARRAVELARTPFTMCALANAEAAAGHRESAEALLREVEALAERQYVSRYWLGSMQLACGRPREAVESLKRAWDDRDWWVMWLAVDPRWEPLRDDPEFRRMAGLNPASTRVYAPETISWSHRYQKPKRRPVSRRKVALIAFVLALAGLLAFIRFRVPSAPFEHVRMTKLTTNGTAVRATMSPDGSRAAFVTTESGKPVLWMRALDQPAPVRMAGPIDGEITALQFTGNGQYIGFTVVPPDGPAKAAMYRIPITGGPLWKTLESVPGSAAFAYSGERVAWLRSNRASGADELYVANTDGSGATRVAARRYPDRFAMYTPPAWSRDGVLIAAAVLGSDRDGFYTKLGVASAAGGGMRVIDQPRWQYVERIAWIESYGLLVTGQEYDSAFQQIWYVPYPKGAPKRISNDLNNYAGVSADTAAKAFVSVQVQTLANLYTVRRDGDASHAIQITPGAGRYFDLVWGPGDRILYASDASGTADIWTINADGSGQRRLTTGRGRSYAPTISTDGRIIAFHSNRSGNWNIWRMDADGANAQQLTIGHLDSDWPNFSADGQMVYYRRLEENAVRNIWRVPAVGGAPVRVTDKVAARPTVFPPDGRIACWYSEDTGLPKLKLAILPGDGGTPTRLFDIPPTVPPGSALRWTPKGDGIAFVDRRGGVWNIWVQPVDGGALHPITSFPLGEVYSFDWSADGRLVYSQGMTTSDVVLLQETNE